MSFSYLNKAKKESDQLTTLETKAMKDMFGFYPNEKNEDPFIELKYFCGAGISISL